MGARGNGYGSEFHLRGSLGDPVRRAAFTQLVSQTVGVPATIDWLPYPKTGKGDRELTGVEFLSGNTAVKANWAEFWPQRGRQQSWDAVGLNSSTGEWLLVEAKANHPELCSPSCGATGDASRKKIVRAMTRTKKFLGVHSRFSWLGTYYQYANRLAFLFFLNQIAKIPARLVFVYFSGDHFPDGTPCPSSDLTWKPLIHAAHLTLGLPDNHRLSDRVHDVFPPVALNL